MKNEPLLRNMKYTEIMDTLTPRETQEAQELLAPMLKDFIAIDRNSIVVLAYLLGTREGIHKMQDASSRKSISEDMSGIYHIGKAHGLATATLLFGKGDTISVAMQREIDDLVTENVKLRKACGLINPTPSEKV